ncbi:hypothetical protein AXG93_2852s1470 [Marchantia polymorpha subsp. ruderalis]|nr:hypothetical protein AXG93_2852s1470 [Marchantia polymorpha subsp. ruderalis]
MGETNMEALIAVFKSWFVYTVAAVGLLYVVLKVFSTVRHKSGRRPPGPPSLPLIGHLHHLVSGFSHQTLVRIAEKYAPIMWLDLGPVDVVVVSSSDMAREILKTQDHIFASRPPTLVGDLVFGKGQDLVFSPLNDNARLVRKVFTTRLLSQKRIDLFKAENGKGKFSNIMEPIIDNRLKENTNSKSYDEEDFLDVLLAMSYFTRDQVKYLLLDIILAGTDTTSYTIVWAITELLRHPNFMERLQSELDDVIGKERLVEEADLQKLEYLEAVVKETLRLHPVGVIVPRYSMEATKVAGYDIPPQYP